MTDLSTIRLFATHPHRCSYLEGEEATTVFVDPSQRMSGKLYGRLSELGFRRSGAHVYRPQCASCAACVPARIPVSRFTPSRQQKRCWKRNQDLSIATLSSIDTDEHYQLYARYISKRHHDGDMYPPTREQFRSFLTSEWGVTRYLEFRLDSQLMGVAVCDQLDNALSAVYTFYEPEMNQRSLGTFGILLQIHVAQEKELDFVYLGYWIENCDKMNYKTQFRPLEILNNRSWRSMS